MNTNATPLKMTDEIKNFVNTSLDEPMRPMLLAVVTKDGKPHLSFRGSVKTYSDTQLGFWVRNAAGATFDALKTNPNVSFMYRSPSPVAIIQFHGKARVTTDEAERNKVFEASPEREQKSDPERKGFAVIIDLEQIDGVIVGEGGPKRFNMVK